MIVKCQAVFRRPEIIKWKTPFLLSRFYKSSDKYTGKGRIQRQDISPNGRYIQCMCKHTCFHIYIYINAKWLHIYTKTYFCGGEVSVFEEVISLSFI